MANCKVWLHTAGMNLWLTVRECVAAEVGRQYTENPETRVFTLQLPLICLPKSISVSLNLNFLFCKMRELLILKILPSTKNLHTLHCASWTDAHWSIRMRASILRPILSMVQSPWLARFIGTAVWHRDAKWSCSRIRITSFCQLAKGLINHVPWLSCGASETINSNFNSSCTKYLYLRAKWQLISFLGSIFMVPIEKLVD
jgi:hypothetical protein